MSKISNEEERGNIVNSLSRLEYLITQSKKQRILYYRTQMKVYSILHATFEQRLEILDLIIASQKLSHEKY